MEQNVFIRLKELIDAQKKLLENIKKPIEKPPWWRLRRLRCLTMGHKTLYWTNIHGNFGYYACSYCGRQYDKMHY